ncbi:MAG: AI-2E family transporter [Clostridiales bacterium]|nr:AI-2E family transporter [Clostridiales bacterium]
MGKPDEKLKKILKILGITGAVYGCFRYLLPLVIPFLAAWALALLLEPSARWISRHACIHLRGRRIGVSTALAGSVELAVGLILLGIGLYYGGQKLCAETGLLLERFPAWLDRADLWLTKMCHSLEDDLCLSPGVLVSLLREMLVDLADKLKSGAMPYLMANSVSVFRFLLFLFIVAVITFVSVGLSLQEMENRKERLENSVFRNEFIIIGACLRLVVSAYLKTQGVILLLTCMLCMAGLWLMGNPYYLLAGIGIGIMDALPLLGSGMVFLPWALICFLTGRVWTGVPLLILYLACYLLREILEARLMSGRVGLSPLDTLIAMVVGLQLFGFWGFLLGPVGVLLIRDLVTYVPS